MLRFFFIFIQPNVCLSYYHHVLSVDGVEVNLKTVDIHVFYALGYGTGIQMCNRKC
jgi:hypothetical protein